MPTRSSSGISKAHRKVIFASSLGTMFEWYDFYLYGSLATVIGKHFFSGVNETTSFIFALLAFAAGFAVRPFGAVVFGRIGDTAGRKHAYLITIVIMGVATALVGVLPGRETIGMLAPVILITLRLIQGLAVGGHYGGAAVYIAEHAPPGKRGYYTSWLQITAIAGMAVSLVVIIVCRQITGAEFDAWGWRVPFLLSVLLLGLSVYIRLQLEESPVFHEMRAAGQLSKQPLRDSIGNWKNLRLILLALLGAVAAQAVTGYIALVYCNLYLIQSLKMDATGANLLVAGSLVAVTPFYVIFGKLSDHIGRKPLVMIGSLVAVFAFFPIFRALTHYANPAIEAAQQTAPIVVTADPHDCHFQFDPLGTARFTSSCDVAKSALASLRLPYSNEAASPAGVALVRVGHQTVAAFDGSALSSRDFEQRSGEFKGRLARLAEGAGYPRSADPGRVNYVMVFLLLFVISLINAAIYAPIAAWLVELFPPSVRYTSMSLPYHLGNGWFGGFLPSISFATIAYTGDIYSGLWYPSAVCLMVVVVGTLLLRDTRGLATTDD